jgi:DNA mismatch repair protein MutL
MFMVTMEEIMPQIHVLDEATINQIAAGEVVERPSAVVKELIENAMDAGATAITAEIKDGGLSFIRITDNGAGIAREDIPLAFLRHATSKIKTAEDLLSVLSLGFRGEALSSICAVAQVELITKTPSSLNGFRFTIEGGEEKSFEEIGCPGGTTIIVRNLFYNTPARRNFLKSAMTEGGYISDLMERLIVSHPGVSFKFIVNNQVKLQSAGNNNCKDILYNVYGRDVAKELLPIDFGTQNFKITGFIGKPIINRGNRNFENYFINGRYIKSNVITRAIEEAYKPFMMQHKYPFTSLYFDISPQLIDVNVHPQKMEIRLKNSEEVYQFTYEAIRSTLAGKEMIPRVVLTPQEEVAAKQAHIPEPFEVNRRKELGIQSGVKPQENSMPNAGITSSENFKPKDLKNNNLDNHNLAMKHLNTEQILYTHTSENEVINQDRIAESNTSYQSNHKERIAIDFRKENILASNSVVAQETKLQENNVQKADQIEVTPAEQMNLFQESEVQENAPFLSKKALDEHRIIGQVFSTYWLVEYQKELYIIDQHAAHEKVLYERIIAAAKSKTYHSQQLLPPIVLSLTIREQQVLQKQEEVLKSLGYEIEHFGGNEYSVRAVPADLYGISEKALLQEFIDELAEESSISVTGATAVLERIASLSCKAAVKANHSFSTEEASALIKELLTLENPYHCPHGRPVIVSMSKTELERKFKRIL